MENVLYAIEQMVFLITWEFLYRKVFPQCKFQRLVLGITYSISIIGFFAIMGQRVSKQLGPVIGIGISGGIVFVTSRRKQMTSIIETLTTYIVSRAIWLLSISVSFILSRSLGRKDIFVESIFICISQIVLVLIVSKYIRKEW